MLEEEHLCRNRGGGSAPPFLNPELPSQSILPELQRKDVRGCEDCACRLPPGQLASSPQGLLHPLPTSAWLRPSIYVSGSRQCGSNSENEDGSREVVGCEGTKRREENTDLHSLLVLPALFSKNRQPAEGLCNFWWAWQMACWLRHIQPSTDTNLP